MVNLIPKEETQEQEIRERNKPKENEQSGSSTSSTADSSSGKTCPISGKEGTCPVSSLMPAGAKSVRGSKKDDSNDAKSSILWSLCPIHMDAVTLKVMTIVAIISWISGFGSGFMTRKIFFR